MNAIRTVAVCVWMFVCLIVVLPAIVFWFLPADLDDWLQRHE